MTAAVGHQKGGGRESHSGHLKVAQIATSDTPEAYLAISADRRGECVSCACLVVRRITWGKLPAATRKAFREAGIRSLESRGLCRTCYTVAVGNGRLDEFPVSDWSDRVKENVRAQRTAIQERVDFPALWAEVQGAGGGLKEMSEKLGVTTERVRQIVKELDLPKTHSLKVRAAIFLEELEHLAGLGQGVGYISRALGMTEDALVGKVNHLHQTGKTKVHFHGYHHQRNMEKEAA